MVGPVEPEDNAEPLRIQTVKATRLVGILVFLKIVDDCSSSTSDSGRNEATCHVVIRVYLPF